MLCTRCICRRPPSIRLRHRRLPDTGRDVRWPDRHLRRRRPQGGSRPGGRRTVDQRPECRAGGSARDERAAPVHQHPGGAPRGCAHARDAGDARSLIDLTQVYQVRFDPSINDGEAANRLQASGLVATAMPDYRLRTPPHEQAPTSTRPLAARAAVRRAAAARAFARRRAAAPTGSAALLPPNYSYATDGQSYHDAASNNVTGAIVALAKKYHQMPGQGTVITNISLGTIDDSSTVTEDGQRFLEQPGFPKIPAYLSHLVCDAVGNLRRSASTATATTPRRPGRPGRGLLDFSVMAPPPRGDVRVPNPQPPGQLGEILGAAYGADYRLINPLVNSTPDFLAAWHRRRLPAESRPSVITASIGNGLPPGEFPDDQFEAETIIRDIVTTLVQGQDIFVTISAGDGQTDTGTAGPAERLFRAVHLSPPGTTPPDLDSSDPADPDYTYLWTNEERLIPDSGSNSAGGTTLNDIFNHSPNNTLSAARARHNQTTTETRWTGQQNFHSGRGARVNVGGACRRHPVPGAGGGRRRRPGRPGRRSSRSWSAVRPPPVPRSPPRQRSSARSRGLTGHPLTAVQTRDLLVATGHDEPVTPTFDLTNHNIGRMLDLTAAVNARPVQGPRARHARLVRMTVAQRKAMPCNTGYGRSFYTDTPQDPVARTATIDLSQGLAAGSSFNIETIGADGRQPERADHVRRRRGVPAGLGALLRGRCPMAVTPSGCRPGSSTQRAVSLRLLPSEIFGLLHRPLTGGPTVVRVTARPAGRAITERVTFVRPAYARSPTPPRRFHVAGHAGAARSRSGMTFAGSGSRVRRTDRERHRPGGAARLHRPRHRRPRHQVPAARTGRLGERPAVGIAQAQASYGLALRGRPADGIELNGLDGATDTTGAWIPLRVMPGHARHADVAEGAGRASGFGTLRRSGGMPSMSSRLAPTSSPSPSTCGTCRVPGGRSSSSRRRPPTSSARCSSATWRRSRARAGSRTRSATGSTPATGSAIRVRSATRRCRARRTGTALFTTGGAGLTTPADPASCDHTYQVRVFATDGRGRIIGSSSYTSLLSVADLSSASCTPPPPPA